MPKPHQKYIRLSDLAAIEFLEALRDFGNSYARKALSLTKEEARYYKRKYNAYDERKIGLALYKLDCKIKGIPPEFDYRNYKKQETCDHHDFTIFFKCKCTKVLSEKDIDELMEILQREKEKLKVGVRVFDLTGNKVSN